MNARARKKIIQFPHPSGEECSKNIVNGVKRWNDGRHKRNFIEILGFAISVAVSPSFSVSVDLSSVTEVTETGSSFFFQMA